MKKAQLIITLILLSNLSIIKAQSCEELFKEGDKKYELKDFKSAIDLYSKAILIDTNNAGIYINRGICEAELHNYREAISDYNIAITKSPTFPYVYYNRAQAEMEISDYDNALLDLDKTISQKPNPKIIGSVYYIRGQVNFKLGKTEQACLDILKAKELGYMYIDETFLKLCK